MLQIAIQISSLLIAQIEKPPQQFLELENQLKKYGFEVIIELPPKRGAYGLLKVSLPASLVSQSEKRFTNRYRIILRALSHLFYGHPLTPG